MSSCCLHLTLQLRAAFPSPDSVRLDTGAGRSCAGCSEAALHGGAEGVFPSLGLPPGRHWISIFLLCDCPGLLLQKRVNSEHRQHPWAAEDLPGEVEDSTSCKEWKKEQHPWQSQEEEVRVFGCLGSERVGEALPQIPHLSICQPCCRKPAPPSPSARAGCHTAPPPSVALGHHLNICSSGILLRAFL